MRIRIIVDTQDDDGGDKPFTLIAHRDDDDGTQTREPLDIGGGSVVGGSIPRMLRELADAWENGDVTGWDGPMPRTADEWRAEPAP